MAAMTWNMRPKRPACGLFADDGDRDRGRWRRFDLPLRRRETGCRTGQHGADPGPACYGRGGPLAVTDLNYYQGKILAEYFPFPLDRDAVASRLSILADEVAAGTGVEYTPHQLAEGFLRVVDTNMVQAIRSISIAKGCDPRDYVLVAFGGAAGQHACAVAAELGIGQVLLHPDAGVLSAYGISTANVTRHAAAGVYQAYSEAQVAELDAIFDRLAAPLRQEILAEGIPADGVAIGPRTRSSLSRRRVVPNHRRPDVRYIRRGVCRGTSQALRLRPRSAVGNGHRACRSDWPHGNGERRTPIVPAPSATAATDGRSVVRRRARYRDIHTRATAGRRSSRGTSHHLRTDLNDGDRSRLGGHMLAGENSCLPSAKQFSRPRR